MLEPGGILGFTAWAHSEPFYLLQHAASLIPTAPNMRTTDSAVMPRENGYWHDRSFIRQTLIDLGLTEIRIEPLDFRQKGKDARDWSRKMRVVVKVYTSSWEQESRWETFSRIEEVLRGDYGDGEAWVRSVACVVTAKKPS